MSGVSFDADLHYLLIISGGQETYRDLESEVGSQSHFT